MGRYAPRVRVWLAVAIGGALGALSRWSVGEGVLALLGPSPQSPLAMFPWATLAVNVVGCALIGVLAPVVVTRSAWVAGFVVTGFLGGFTTYSAFAEEVFVLADRGDAVGVMLASVYVVVTILSTAGAVLVGSRLAPRLAGAGS